MSHKPFLLGLGLLVAIAGFAAVPSVPPVVDEQATCPVVEDTSELPDELAPACGEDAELLVSGPDAQPMAICRLLPECWTNADCDAKCGPAGGRCRHSRCPARFCDCN